VENTEPTSVTPIIRAIRYTEKKSTSEIRVHVVKNFLEKDPMASALRRFDEFGMSRTAQRNAVLIYLNRTKRRFAIVGDEGVHRAVGQRYWDEIAVNFAEDLQSTHYENAISLLVYALGSTLAKKFPRGA
jgi:uncharacterized membrane protein